MGRETQQSIPGGSLFPDPFNFLMLNTVHLCLVTEDMVAVFLAACACARAARCEAVMKWRPVWVVDMWGQY